MEADPEMRSRIDALASSRIDGHTLPQPFYSAPEIYEADLELLAARWLLVGHASGVPNSGNWMLAELGHDSFIVSRGRDGEIRAFHNVCRHRGSRICLEASGHSTLFVCPYHSWSYRLDGSLKSAREMGPEFNPDEHGLESVQCEVVDGLIFLSPRGDRAAFLESLAPLRANLGFHSLDRTTVAAQRTYPTAANWKLVVENFLECYHCAAAHPEYSAVHSRAKLEAFGAGPGSGDPAAVERFQPRLEQWRETAETLGHPTDLFSAGVDSLQMMQSGRAPIGEASHISETEDGALGCKRLLDGVAQSDGGQTGMSFSPVSYIMANCDFATMLTFRPTGPLTTEVDAVWLVHEDAIEGQDYDVDRLMWVWDVTLKQDKQITENNQLGVLSSGYQPGPYAQSEMRVDTFVRWYLQAL